MAMVFYVIEQELLLFLSPLPVLILLHWTRGIFACLNHQPETFDLWAKRMQNQSESFLEGHSFFPLHFSSFFENVKWEKQRGRETRERKYGRKDRILTRLPMKRMDFLKQCSKKVFCFLPFFLWNLTLSKSQLHLFCIPIVFILRDCDKKTRKKPENQRTNSSYGKMSFERRRIQIETFSIGKRNNLWERGQRKRRDTKEKREEGVQEEKREREGIQE